MKTLNKVMLLGSVGKDPEIKSTSGGTMVANLSLATSERYRDSAGNWQEKPEWHNLVAFAKIAEVIRDYVKKGDPLHIEGKIQTRSWDDKESGQKKYRTEILVDNLILLGGNREKRSNPAPSAAEMGFKTGEVTDEDIPF